MTIIRPRQSVLAALTVASGGLIVLVVAGALRTGQPIFAWFGVVMALLFLPVVEFYRRAIVIEEDGLCAKGFQSVTIIPFDDIVGYGIRTQWAYKLGAWTWLSILGRGGSRIDIPTTVCRLDEIARLTATIERCAPQAVRVVPPAPPRDVRLTIVIVAAAMALACSLLLVGYAWPRTLDEERLFTEAATVGIVAGLIIGAWSARRVLHRAPAAYVTAFALVAMFVVPAAAFIDNIWPSPATARSARTAPITLLSRRSYTDRDGRIVYVVDVEIEGIRKRLSPDRVTWDALTMAGARSACIRDGALGFPVITSLTHACPSQR